MLLKLDRELKINSNTAEFELLVPANNVEIAKKAILAGADAVYIGFSKFGARFHAGNSISDLIELVDFAHIYKAKVYVTLNTILNDNEILEVEKLINKLYEIKIDGIIIQDMGILELDLPPVPLIASTQCNNTTVEKIKFLEKTGFKRVILPREMSISEIRNIKQNTNIELECFIHGALCVSYSGQCYMSYINGGRSANRGECAQCCRKKYSLKDFDGRFIIRDKNILSLKDLNLSEHLEELIFNGVTSFKIEGRLKNETYVINTTAFYRQKIDKILENYNLKRSSEGISKFDFEPDINKTFNRGYTDFNFKNNKKNIATVNYTSSLGEFTGVVKNVKKNYFTLNSNILNNGDGICFFDEYNDLTGTNINKVENDIIFPAVIKGIKAGTKIYRNFDKIFDATIKSANIERKIPISLKMRETETGYWFFLFDNNKNCAVYGIDKNSEIANNQDRALNTLKIQLSKLGNTEFKIEYIDISIKKIPYLKTAYINEIRRILTDKLRYIRRKTYSNQYNTKEKIIAIYPEAELDFKANIFNEKAALFYKKRGSKIKEFALESQKKFDNREIMISKYCLKKQFGLCPKQNGIKKFREPFILIDEANKEYLVDFECSKCVMRVINRN